MSQLSAATATKAAAVASPVVLQRKCACGTSAAGLTGECSECQRDTMRGLQKKLAIGAADDPLEREADRAAERVMAMRSRPMELSQMHRPVLSRFAAGNAAGADAAALVGVHGTLQSAGDPLSATLRDFFEPRFGHDFGRVRLHSDQAAALSAEAVNARAYTVGPHIVFAPGAYAPAAEGGRTLIAHELAHVLQQSAGGAPALGLQRVPEPGASGVPSGVPPTAPRKEDRAAKGEACPSCICPPEHVDRLEAARTTAIRVYERAVEELKPLEPPVRRLFEATFGPGSASAEAVATTAETFGKAASFLESSKVWTSDVNGNIHCDQTNETDSCVGGATGHYRRGNVVVCSENPSAAQMLNPPTVPTVYRPEGKMGSTEQSEQPRQVPDPSATKAAQEKSDQEYAARLTALLAHEAVHHIVKPGVVDIYRHERLFAYLGGSGKKLGVDLSPLAMQNPDSLVAFAFKAPAAGGGSSIPGADAALSVPEKPSSKLSVRPLLGRRRARLVVALAQEAIEQSDEALSVLLSEVESVKSGGSAWTLFPQPSQEVVQLLTDVGKETAFAQPDSAALTRLQQISAAFGRLVKSMRSRKLVIGRRFLHDKPKERIEIAIPYWGAFRKMPPSDQFALLIRTLLNEEPTIRELADVVIAHAATKGGMAFLKPDREQEEENDSEGDE